MVTVLCMIRGCIVEDHNDIVSFVLKQWKAQITEADSCADQPRVLVHYDAHPDLSLNAQTTQAQCLQLSEMVEHLSNGDGGIAEFILPLFYCRYLSECIWIKPHWATQMKSGEYVFAFGVDRATGFMRVTCQEDYYLDEEVIADMDDLDHIQTVVFTVLDEMDAPDQLVAMLAGKQWVFDCCLDFFTCSNPFIVDLIEQNVSVDSVAAIQSYYMKAPHRLLNSQFTESQPTMQDLIGAATAFNRLTKQLFQLRDQHERCRIVDQLKALYRDDRESAPLDTFAALLGTLSQQQIELVCTVG